MADGVSDMITRIRNAIRNESAYVDVLNSKLNRSILDAVAREGYIWSYEAPADAPRILRVALKYAADGGSVVRHLRRVSRPGCRVYSAVEELPQVLQGLGVCIVSTNRGIVSSREARQMRVGGEVLFVLW
ncbi:30S ribosomal protein S8 [Schlesneria paludicola]|uniref:30S ribosomal protein S8 n=1 Tax=Schlesneria paludicola TaxID=360056 RepID=UPI00029A809A|nr:30S ribosomal protein S8 [Schlesneria paludicola]